MIPIRNLFLDIEILFALFVWGGCQINDNGLSPSSFITNSIVTDSLLDAEQAADEGRHEGSSLIRRKARRYE